MLGITDTKLGMVRISLRIAFNFADVLCDSVGFWNAEGHASYGHCVKFDNACSDGVTDDSCRLPLNLEDGYFNVVFNKEPSTTTVTTTTQTTVTSSTRTTTTNTIAQAMGRLPSMDAIEKLIESQVLALTGRMEAAEGKSAELEKLVATLIAETGALKADNVELRTKLGQKTTLPDAVRAQLDQMQSSANEVPAPPPCGSGGDALCVPEIEAEGVELSLRSRSGTITFETADCKPTDMCTLIQAVTGLLEMYD